MPLTADCTQDRLYSHLKELGADIKRIRKKNPSFVELERVYYELLDSRLSGRSKRLSKAKY